jgi:hypothetical protein
MHFVVFETADGGSIVGVDRLLIGVEFVGVLIGIDSVAGASTRIVRMHGAYVLQLAVHASPAH